MKKPTKKKLGLAKNQAAAAAKCGVTVAEVKRAAKSASVVRSNGTVDCDALAQWLKANPKPEQDTATDIENEKLLHIRANREWIESRTAERNGLMVLKETARRAWSRNVLSCKGKLYSAEAQASVEIGIKLGLRPEQTEQVRSIIASHHKPAIKELFQGEFGKVECPLCKGEIKQ